MKADLAPLTQMTVDGLRCLSRQLAFSRRTSGGEYSQKQLDIDVTISRHLSSYRASDNTSAEVLCKGSRQAGQGKNQGRGSCDEGVLKMHPPCHTYAIRVINLGNRMLRVGWPIP